MKCFYHGDPDGKCAGFWVKNFVVPHDNYPVVFIRMDYNSEFPLDDVKDNEQVYIVDYSIEPDVMRQLLSKTQDVTWIDHHISAMKKYADFEQEIKGLRVDGISGCVLTYIYLRHMTNNGTGTPRPFDKAYVEMVPTFTLLIGDRDVWDWKYGEKTKNFFEGLQAYEHEPESPVWLELSVSEDTIKWEKEGETVGKYKEQMNRRLLEEYSYETEFEGYRAIACNTTQQGSELFDVIKDEYPLQIVYNHTKNGFAVSLYSTLFDVSEIAAKHGGGGHKGAAGFTSKTLPFSQKEAV